MNTFILVKNKTDESTTMWDVCVADNKGKLNVWGIIMEVEAFACTNLVAKIEQGKLAKAPIWTDIKTFNGRPFRDRIHIITGGYPCQPFSVAGKRKGTDDPRHLWPHIERIIETVRPLWFFGENVAGHLAIGFPKVYRSLRLMGYTVEAGLFTTAECGAPHRRERLFILAYNGNGNTREGGLRPQGSMQSIEKGRETQSAGVVSGQSNSQRRKELADTKRTRQQSSLIRQGLLQFRGKSLWPAYPGQPQYEWEEPRVVVNTKSKWNRRINGNDKCSQEKNRQCEQQYISGSKLIQKGQAQSRLGRATYGTTSRVDRLRLLGNGVVPQCAEKAFITLMALFEKG